MQSEFLNNLPRAANDNFPLDSRFQRFDLETRKVIQGLTGLIAETRRRIAEREVLLEARRDEARAELMDEASARQVERALEGLRELSQKCAETEVLQGQLLSMSDTKTRRAVCA